MKNFLLSVLLLFSFSIFAQDDNVIEANDPPILVFTSVEQMPEFPGGQEALNNFLISNLVYPKMAQDSAIEGRVYVKFTITTSGEVIDIKILNKTKLGYGLEEEAIRVVSIMPKWIPGKQNGRPVSVYFNLPINFKLK